MSATIQLSTRAEIDGLESKRTTALKSDMKYVGKDGSLQVLVFTHNCTRVLMRILLESGLFEEKWWPQTHASPSMMRVSTRSKCDQFELSLNKLERLPREDITRMVKALLAIDTQKKWPYFTEVMQDFLAQRDEAFDQYSGVRQVGDLRGIPGRGAALFIAAKKEVDMLFNFAHCVFVFAFANVYNDVSFGGGSLGILNKIAPVSKAAFAQLPREYELMLSAIVDCLGCLRSKLAKSPNGDSYNDLYKKYFIDDVIRAASELEVTKKSEFDALIATVDQLSEAQRRVVLDAHGGRPALLARAATAFANIRPWAVDWLRVQQQAFGLREVFGDSNDDLCRHLDASKQAVIMGFKELLSSGAADPVAALADEMTIIADEVKQARMGTAERKKK